MSVNEISNLDRTLFQDEFWYDYERMTSRMKKTVRSDGVMAGKTVTFDVVDPSEEAQQRTRDGDIPVANLGLGQVTADLQEDFGGKYKIDDFDAFRTNKKIRDAHYMKAGGACYRKMDKVIIDTLDTATATQGTIDFSSYGAILTWIAALENNDVPTTDGNVWGVVTPTALRRMQTINEFISADYVGSQKLEDGIPADDGYYRWLGVNWFSHTGLTGKGTATATCHLFHNSAIGHMDNGSPDFEAYWFQPQARYECYARVWHCAALCLPRGVNKAVHDDTATIT